MSILLSDKEIQELYYDFYNKTRKEQREMVDNAAKASAIHVIQHMEEPCTDHLGSIVAADYKQHKLAFEHRFNCPKCMEEIHKELGI